MAAPNTFNHNQQLIDSQCKELVSLTKEVQKSKKQLAAAEKQNMALQVQLTASHAIVNTVTGEEEKERNHRLSCSLKTTKEEVESLREDIRQTSRRYVDEERKRKHLETDLRHSQQEAEKNKKAAEEAQAEVAKLKAQMGGLQEDRRFGQGKGTPLREAARNNDSTEVTRLIQEGMDPNQDEDGEGRTPIFWAAQCGAVEAIAALAAGGADVRQRARADAKVWRWRGDDPLTTASQCGQAGACRALLEASAAPDIDVQCEYQQNDDVWYSCTPLLAACVAGQASVVSVLLEFGANYQVHREDGSSPVHCAVRADRGDGSVEAVRHLAAKNADLNCRDLDGWTPLLHAITLRCLSCVRVLLALGSRLGDALEQHPYGTDLVDAVVSDDVGLIAALLESGTDPDKPKCEPEAVAHTTAGMVSFTPLCAAVRYRRRTCVSMFLDKQADPNKRSILWQGSGEETTYTPLTLAATSGDVDILKQLLNHSASIDLETESGNGYTALHAAAESVQPAVVQALLEAGANAGLVAERDGMTLGTPADLCRESSPETCQLIEHQLAQQAAAEMPAIEG